jgi:hypothetical protein
MNSSDPHKVQSHSRVKENEPINGSLSGVVKSVNKACLLPKGQTQCDNARLYMLLFMPIKKVQLPTYLLFPEQRNVQTKH